MAVLYLVFLLASLFGFIGVIYPTPIHKKLKITNRWKSLAAWILAAALAGAVTPSDGDKKADQSAADKPIEAVKQDPPKEEPPKEEKKEEKPKPKPKGIGDKVTAGKLSYRVDEVEEKAVLKNALGSKKPGSGKFLIVTVTIFNNDKEGRAISEGFVKLIGPDGAEYESSADAMMYMEGESALFDNINPHGSKQYKIVFDVSKDVKTEEFKFVGTAGFSLSSEKAVIQLK